MKLVFINDRLNYIINALVALAGLIVSRIRDAELFAQFAAFVDAKIFLHAMLSVVAVAMVIQRIPQIVGDNVDSLQ